MQITGEILYIHREGAGEEVKEILQKKNSFFIWG